MFTLCLFLSFVIITEEHHSLIVPHSFGNKHHTVNHRPKTQNGNHPHNQNIVNAHTFPHPPPFPRNEKQIANRWKYPKRMFNYRHINKVMGFMYTAISIVLIGIMALVLFSIMVRMFNNWYLNYQRKQFEKYQFIAQHSSDIRNVCNNNIVAQTNKDDVVKK